MHRKSNTLSFPLSRSMDMSTSGYKYKKSRNKSKSRNVKNNNTINTQYSKVFNNKIERKSRFIKSQNRCGRSRSGLKAKSSSTNKKHPNIFFSEFDYNDKYVRNNKLYYLSDSIKYKNFGHLQNKNSSKPMKRNKKQRRQVDKQNQMTQNYQQICMGNTKDKFILNQELIRASLKPNKVNFMNRVSNIYDLLISKVMLPQFVQYFLGQALYSINNNRSSVKTSGILTGIYDWKLDEFKKICEKIYQNSEEQDLKHFMSLSLPNVSRWTSKINSTKNNSTKNSTLHTNTLPTHIADSRLSQTTFGGVTNKDRLSYFKCLNKKQRFSLGNQKDSYDILDKLNSKLDNYLRNNYQMVQKKANFSFIHPENQTSKIIPIIERQQ